MPVIKGLDWLDIYQTGWQRKCRVPSNNVSDYSDNFFTEYGCHYFYSYHARHEYDGLNGGIRALATYWINMYAGSEVGESFPNHRTSHRTSAYSALYPVY